MNPPSESNLLTIFKEARTSLDKPFESIPDTHESDSELFTEEDLRAYEKGRVSIFDYDLFDPALLMNDPNE